MFTCYLSISRFSFFSLLLLHSFVHQQQQQKRILSIARVKSTFIDSLVPVCMFIESHTLFSTFLREHIHRRKITIFFPTILHNVPLYLANAMKLYCIDDNDMSNANKYVSSCCVWITVYRNFSFCKQEKEKKKIEITAWKIVRFIDTKKKEMNGISHPTAMKKSFHFFFTRQQT